jgi:hypothetical protein
MGERSRRHAFPTRGETDIRTSVLRQPAYGPSGWGRTTTRGSEQQTTPALSASETCPSSAAPERERERPSPPSHDRCGRAASSKEETPAFRSSAPTPATVTRTSDPPRLPTTTTPTPPCQVYPEPGQGWWCFGCKEAGASTTWPRSCREGRGPGSCAARRLRRPGSWWRLRLADAAVSGTSWSAAGGRGTRQLAAPVHRSRRDAGLIGHRVTPASSEAALSEPGAD